MATKPWLDITSLARHTAQLGQRRTAIFSIKGLENSPGRYGRLFRAAKNANENPGLSEEVVARSLFPGRDWKKPYSILRTRLKQKLLTGLFALDLKSAGYPPYSLAYYSNNRMVFLCKTLIAFRSRSIATPMAVRGLRDAEAFELWSNGAEFARMLRIGAALRGSKRDHLLYAGKYKYCMEALVAEQTAQEFEEFVDIAFTKSLGEQPQLAPAVRENLTLIERNAERFPTYSMKLFLLRHRSYLYQIEQNYEASLKVCDDVERLFQSYPVMVTTARRHEFALKRVVCHFHRKDFESAQVSLTDCEKLTSRGDHNWFVMKQYEYHLHMHAGDFVHARQIVQRMKAETRFDELSPIRQRRWTFYGLHADYACGRAISVGSLVSLRHDEVSKDKIGFNVALLLFEMLLLLRAGNHDAVGERVESLMTYRIRYLAVTGSEEAKLMFQLVRLFETHSFDYPKIAESSAPLLEKLKVAKLTDIVAGEQGFPFLFLWKELMHAFANNPFPQELINAHRAKRQEAKRLAKQRKQLKLEAQAIVNSFETTQLEELKAIKLCSFVYDRDMSFGKRLMLVFHKKENYE